MRGEEPGKLGQDLAPTARRPACLGCWQWREGTLIYFERKHDCEVCALKPECCKDGPVRKIARSLHDRLGPAPGDRRDETYASQAANEEGEMLSASFFTEDDEQAPRSSGFVQSRSGPRFGR